MMLMKCRSEFYFHSRGVRILTPLLTVFLIHSSITTSVFSQSSESQDPNFHFTCAQITSGTSSARQQDVPFQGEPREESINEHGGDSHNEKETTDAGDTNTAEVEKEEAKREINAALGEIDNISRGNGGDLCTTPSKMYKMFSRVPIGTHIFHIPKEKADLIAFFLSGRIKIDLLELNGTFNSLFAENQLENIQFVDSSPTPSTSHNLYLKGRYKAVEKLAKSTNEMNQFPWYFDPNQSTSPTDKTKFHVDNSMANTDEITGFWTWPYFKCGEQIHSNGEDDRVVNSLNGTWLVSYSVPFLLSKSQSNPRSYGLLSFDIDLSHYRINQCDYADATEKNNDENSNPLHAFRETHKCDKRTTTCQVQKQDEQTGWRKGNYICHCIEAHFALYKQWNNTIGGLEAESTWCSTLKGEEFDSFLDVVSCKRCPTDCPDCNDKHTCMAITSPALRLTLLCVSVFCTVAAIGFIIVVCKFRKIAVFKTSSPIFICIMLSGCIIMYSEMIALYPPLTIASCVAVKWTRHLGFCITYTALALKLCRVYLTFRVKSAHKIKLTEKHLLHWMSPIMVIMLLYLFAWTISDPPDRELMNTVDDKRFYQCIYNWWDHALAIGEVIFLAYGVWICWKIRENPDAQFISYSIYNIAIVNVVMVSLHLLIVPKAGPDMKYVLAFARTQFSTTTTIGLVFGSKLIRVWRGEGPSLKEIANSANGFGQDTLDLAEENLQLKEELQKMATQIEKLKFYAMCKNNPHLKQCNVNANNAEIDFTRLESFSAL